MADMSREFYDAAVVFGMRYDRPHDPETFFNSLDAAAEAFKAGCVGYIAVSGKGWVGGQAPRSLDTESHEGSTYLQTFHAIPAERILEEPESTSTVDNILNVKRRYMLESPYLRRLWCPIAEYTIPRRTFVARKVMGPEVITFSPVACPPEEIWDMEEKSYRQHLAILRDMPEGSHEWLLDDNRQSKWMTLMKDYLRLTEPELFLSGGPFAE